ncbi:hypothetical protein F4779DRAFT_613155 [Xylariaceae sp. FL0662B]|nr:hypothetical protein F4779DRAFT_613155 [Xylariaceae sp. FL0662B]
MTSSTSTSTPVSSPLTLTRTTLPLQSLPRNAFLVHATNCLGEWGSGIAAELRRLFPAAFEVYRSRCESCKPRPSARYPTRDLAGRCLIIPPQDADVAAGAPSVSVVCLFTSYGYGRANNATGKPGRDATATILQQTERALASFRRQLREREGAEGDAGVGAEGGGGGGRAHGIVVYSPRFNSGAFRVPWEKTERLIKETFADWEGRWFVLAPP